MTDQYQQSLLLGKIAAYTEILVKDYNSTIFVSLAETYRKLGMFDDARQIISKGLTLHPDFSPAYIVLARTLCQLEDYSGSVTAFEQALEFDDELVLLNKKRAIDISEMMRRHNMPWGCQGRINIVDEEILQHLQRSRCKYVGYGVESYTQKILDKMKKKIRVEQILPVIELTQKYKIHPMIQYMYGFPGESDESIENTYQFFKQIDQPFIGMVTTPLPGSFLYNDVLARNLISDEEDYLMKLTSGYNYASPLVNLTDFTELELMSKKFALEKRINRRYYLRHPLSYLKDFYSKIVYRTKMLFSNPALFSAKVASKLSAIIGK